MRTSAEPRITLRQCGVVFSMLAATLLEIIDTSIVHVSLLDHVMALRGVPARSGGAVTTRVLDQTLESQAWMVSFQDAFARISVRSLSYAPLVPTLRRECIQSG